MIKDNKFRCVKDLHLQNHQVAFTKDVIYTLIKSEGNNRIFRTDQGWEYILKPTEFGLHFRVDNG